MKVRHFIIGALWWMSLAVGSFSQTVETGLPAPRTGLAAVLFPSGEGLEAEVREYLLNAQNELAKLAREAKTTDTELSEAYGKLGQVYHAFALLPAAEACYLNAQRLAPRDYRWLYLLGSLARQARRNDEALAAFTQVQTLRPDYLAAWVNAGELYLEQNHLAAAVAAFTAALTHNEHCAAAHYGLGQVALAQRDYRGAVLHLERALAEAPEANRIHYALAMAQRGLGNLEKAKAHLKLQGAVGVRAADPLSEALSDFARGERWHLLRARRALDAKRYAEAVAEFKLALAANPSSVSALVNLGVALMELGDAEAAREKFQAALRLAPTNAAAHANLGFLFSRQDSAAAAVEHLRAALAQEPADHEARFQLARELIKLKRTDEALTELTRVLESDTGADAGNEAALLEWVKLTYRAQRYAVALDRLKQAHERFPQRGATMALLAFLLATIPPLELRDGTRALALAQQVYQATGAAEHGALVALALAESGRCVEAAAWQRRMISAAESEQKPQLADQLKTELPLFEKAATCRPHREGNALR